MVAIFPFALCASKIQTDQDDSTSLHVSPASENNEPASVKKKRRRRRRRPRGRNRSKVEIPPIPAFETKIILPEYITVPERFMQPQPTSNIVNFDGRNRNDDDNDEIPYDEKWDDVVANWSDRCRKTRTSRIAQSQRPQSSNLELARPRPQVFLASGFRVTMIDWTHKVFVIDMLTPQLCHYIRDLSDVATTPEQWRVLYTHTKADCPANEITGVAPLLDVVSHNTRLVLADIYRTKGVYNLHERSWKEPHLLKYKKVAWNSNKSHTGVRMHHDGSDMTWSLMLSEMHEYSGGGTFFQALRRTLKLNIGQVLIHPGDLMHKGVDITSGERRLAVCFMDGFHPGVQDFTSLYSHNPQDEKNVVITG